MSDEELTLQELEDQDWEDIGGDPQTDITHEFMDGTERTFRVQDPDPDVIMKFVSPSPDDTSREEELFEFVNKAVIAPEITMERWRGLRVADRIMLADKVGEVVGIDRVMGFSDGGLEAQLEELLSGSPESGNSQ
ncbi:hypothetical protein SAMN05192561_1123 [Halopenitus malekzadehii]|uniref:Uncharacterized protein n=1 Tax=Halopenitus malekzadehii TaxID=1267564 RepID=A0A1H6JE07_9EURY|nr:hypothetical protein [Halopenitus malekzadehii]SEH60458.1 hypothetical protein SAMN05192561_1123 [Halopenitus malekzadehii]